MQTSHDRAVLVIARVKLKYLVTAAEYSGKGQLDLAQMSMGDHNAMGELMRLLETRGPITPFMNRLDTMILQDIRDEAEQHEQFAIRGVLKIF